MSGVEKPGVAGFPQIATRPAAPEDMRYVWQVNNDPTVRAQAMHSEDIPWETHVRWYAGQMARSDGGLLIGLDRQRPIGVARFDVIGSEAVITVALSPEHRGRGLGSALVEAVTAQALDRPEVGVAVAYVRPANLASQRAFLNNRYRPVGPRDVAGVTMMRFEMLRGDR